MDSHLIQGMGEKREVKKYTHVVTFIFQKSYMYVSTDCVDPLAFLFSLCILLGTKAISSNRM